MDDKTQKSTIHKNKKQENKAQKLSQSPVKNAIAVDYGSLWQVIYDENKKAVFGNAPADKQIFNGEAEFIDEKVVFLGFLNAHHGHLITDNLGQFWWILQNGTNKHKFIYFCINGGKSISAFESLFFEIFDLNEKNTVLVKKPTKFREIIMPENSFHSPNGIEMERKTIDFITSHIKPVKNEALYLSRRKFNKSTSLEFGEEYFEAQYSKHGYKIIYPESLSPREQLALWGGGGQVCLRRGHLGA